MREVNLKSMILSETHVLIAGAGPSGLTLALELARRGVAFRLIDKADAHFSGARGKGLMPRTMEVFDDLGVVDAIKQHGGPFPTFRGYAGNQVLWDRSLAEIMDCAKFEPGPSAPYDMWMIPQWRTEEILRSRLAEFGGRVELGTELIGFTQDATGVTATLTACGLSETVRACYLVGCDGGRSFVRKTLGVGFTGESGNYRSIIADLKIEGVSRDRWHMWANPENQASRVSLCPMPGTDLFQFSAPVLTNEVPELTLETVRQIFAERAGGYQAQFHGLNWITLYRLNVRMADCFRIGRVFLAGDAAHVHSPFGGQGLNTSIQDAYNLGWKLGAVVAGSPEILLDSYETERLPIAAEVLGISTAMHRQGFRVNSGAGNHRPDLKRDIYQLALNYRGGPLSCDKRGRPGPVRAGDRAPDAPCADATGRALRLFDVFRGSHFTLLTFGNGAAAIARQINEWHRPTVRAHAVAQPAEPNDGVSLIDKDRQIALGYGIDCGAKDGILVLVRPDGYVGFIGTNSSSGSVVDYLGCWIAIGPAAAVGPLR